MTEMFSLVPLGYVRSKFKSRDAIPLHGAPATLELEPAFAEGLTGLEHSSHLIVMGFLHQADRAVLKSTKVEPNMSDRGVFASRSPARPNPISVTVVPLLTRNGLCLEVDRLDLFDGTPIVDLKPYCPGWDVAFCARYKHRAEQSVIIDECFAAYMKRDLENFMGAAAREPVAQWGLAATFVVARRLGIDPRDPDLKVATSRVDETIETLMALTGAAFSNGRLEVVRAEVQPMLFVRFEYRGQRIGLRANASELPRAVSEWKAVFTIEEERI